MKLFWKIVLASAYVAVLGYLIYGFVVINTPDMCRASEPLPSCMEEWKKKCRGESDCEESAKSVCTPENITYECNESYSLRYRIKSQMSWRLPLTIGMALVGVSGVIVWAIKRHRRK